MINNARAESDATSGRGAGGKVLPSTERSEYDDGKQDSPISDGDGFEDDLEAMKHHRDVNMKRGSV